MLTAWASRWKAGSLAGRCAERPAGHLQFPMAETYELERLTDYTIGALLKYPNEVVLSEEVLSFIKNLDGITRTEKKGGTAASGGKWISGIR